MEFQDEGSKLQALMNAAYARYTPSMTKEAFWYQLDFAERKAVAVGNMNCQVCNGGWMQWFDNRYGTAETVGFLRTFLAEVGTPATLKALELMEEAVDVNASASESDDEDDEEYADPYDNLDSEFYKVNDQMLTDVEAHLVAQAR